MENWKKIGDVARTITEELMTRKRKHPELTIMCVEENGEAAIYIEADGKRIAKRGHPDSPQARTWVSLEPGVVVRDRDYPNGIEVEYHNVSAH